jgi:hypothetical protein
MATTPTQKFTTTTTGSVNQPPVAVLAVQRIDALLGSIIQLDGRQSFDPEKQPLSWSWSFVQVPIGSEVESAGFTGLRPNDTAVSFIPDKIGVYVVQLIVNDGELDSNPVTATVNIQLSRVPCGENIIPDAHFLWSHLSNFWNLVVDREKITTIWSSAIQLIGTELIKLWDADNNKSLATIQGTFQRRWQKFAPVTDLLDAPEQRIIIGKVDSGTGGASGNIGEVPGVGNTQVFYLPLGNVGDITATDFTSLAGNYGAKGRVLVVNGEGYTISRASNEDLVLASGSDLDTTAASDTATVPILTPPDVNETQFVSDGVQVGDLLEITTGADAGIYSVSTVVDEHTIEVVNLDSSPVSFTGGTSFVFRVFRPFTVAVVDELAIPDGQVGVPWSVPQLLHVPSVNLEDEGVRPGDIIVFDVTRKDLGLTAELRGQVVGVDRTRLGFEFTLDDLVLGEENISRSAVQQLMRDLKIVPPESTDDDAAAAAEAFIAFIPKAINLNTRPFSTFRITFTAKKIIHNSVIVAGENLISAPALQESIKDPPVVLRENFDYVIDEGKIGFVNGLFTLSDPAPETLWAECAIFDNSDVIETNFGRLVNLSQDDLTEKKTRAPYLSAVKGLFFAYTNGPTVANIRLGLQILLGLPFTEERGEILEIQDNFATDTSGNSLGRILIEDIDDKDNRTGFRRIHFFPSVVGLEENPVTGELYAIGDRVEQFAPLSKGIEVLDYIKDPVWWLRSLQSIEILKYFTFTAIIDGEIFDTNDVTFALDFLRAIKPAYTKIVTNVLLNLVDEIELDDALGGAVTLNFYDNDWGLEATNRSNDDNQQGCVLLHAGSKPFQTRSVKMLRDLVTFENAGKVRVTSAVGWDVNLVRGRDNASIPWIEGDLLYLHQGQPGASLLAPGLYEIDTVIDANTIDLLQQASFIDPETFQVTALVPSLFSFGSSLIGCIMRRETNPIIKGTDLSTNASDNVVTSASANFLLNGVSIGDHLIIESGANQGEYIIDAMTPFTPGPPQQPPLFSATQVKLLLLDGSVASFSALTNQTYRVIRPMMQDEVIEGGTILSGTPRGGRSFYTGSQLELRVRDPLLGHALDVFTPGMVGTLVGVSNSQNSANDGSFMIIGYIDSGTVVLNSGSTTSDTTPGSKINFL